MSICAIAERTILLNVTNMEDREDDKTPEITPGGGGGRCNEIREEQGVKTDSTPTANKPIVVTIANAAPTDGHPIHCRNRPANLSTRKDCLRSLHNRSGNMGSGSSGDPDPVLTEESGEAAAKKRKTRRGKPKHRKQKPYSKQQMCFEERLRSRGRLTKTRGQPPAPYNTTQFLMEDHDLPDLEQKLADVITSDVAPSFQKPLAPPRTRDSSFSVDSDEDYFYSSPEDEEEFLTKEFSSAYEDLHAERLSTMTKTELIQEYVQLEAKLDIMSKRLRGKGLQSEERETEGKNGGGTPAATSTNDSELGKKLKICQQRIDDLIQQNEQLRRDNETLRMKNSGSCSVDSESDSDTSSCSCSGKSGSSPQTSKKLRHEKEHRKSKRQSSVDSESDSDTTTTSKDSSGADKINKNLVNGLSGNLEVLPGLPT